jgi:uncharacterized protein YbbC (DUF1343 family)
MRACAAKGVKCIVLDRPNPIDGVHIEGNVVDPKFGSFVGEYALANRHGMTLGELCRFFAKADGLEGKLDLEIVWMEGWTRFMSFDETGLPWVLPSPNMPSVDTAIVYPGGCLIEGTNLSEGRGATRPFELVGAPWLDPFALARAMVKERLPGVRFRPTYFTPTFHKHAERPCGGVQVHVTDRKRFPAFLTYLLLIAHARAQGPARFAWRDPPYEYEFVKLPIDILCGGEAARRTIESGGSLRRLLPGWKKELQAFEKRRRKYLLYS